MVDNVHFEVDNVHFDCGQVRTMNCFSSAAWALFFFLLDEVLVIHVELCPVVSCAHV